MNTAERFQRARHKVRLLCMPGRTRTEIRRKLDHLTYPSSVIQAAINDLLCCSDVFEYNGKLYSYIPVEYEEKIAHIHPRPEQMRVLLVSGEEYSGLPYMRGASLYIGKDLVCPLRWLGTAITRIELPEL
jgi:hypothetical protein